MKKRNMFQKNKIKPHEVLNEMEISKIRKCQIEVTELKNSITAMKNMCTR